MIDKNNYDLSLVFQTYFAFQGDVARTAVALNLSDEEVRALAASENWDTKVKQWSVVKEGSSADAAIAINRVSNLVTAKRIQDLVNRVVTHLGSMDGPALAEYLGGGSVRKDRDGNEIRSVISAKVLTELAKAAEACEVISRRALGDTDAERPENKAGAKGSSIALMVQSALAASESAGVSPVLAIRDQMTPPHADRPTDS